MAEGLQNRDIGNRSALGLGLGLGDPRVTLGSNGTNTLFATKERKGGVGQERLPELPKTVIDLDANGPNGEGGPCKGMKKLKGRAICLNLKKVIKDSPRKRRNSGAPQ